MKAQDVIWTALPNGRKDASTLKLSVYISPRLMTDQGLPVPKLSQFKDFLNWPTVPVSFKVFMGASGPFTATNVTVPAAANDLYTSVFKTTTYVRPHVFPSGLAGSARIRSYPVRQIRSFIKNVYTDAITSSPSDHPPLGRLNSSTSFGSIGFVAPDPAGGSGEQREAQLAAQLETILQRNQWVDFSQFSPSDPNYNALAFLLAKRFHQPRSGLTEVPTDPVVLKKPTLGAAGPDKAIDFHQMITLATEHPALMRYFGLVVDLEFQPTGVPFGTTNVRVVPTWTPQLAATKNYSPKTRCKFNGSTFAAAPRTVSPELADGALPLDDPTRFDLVEIDHDGAALKAMQFANNIQRGQLPEHTTDDTPTSYAPPSLRSGGLSVARVGMAGQLLGNLNTSTALDGTFKSGATLNAEDVVRGYAVHIWDSASGKWHSLLNRTGTYDFVDKPESVPVADEGAVSLGPTSDPLAASPDLYQQETLFLWSGWSLAAQRPGNTLVPDPAHDPGGPMQRYDSTADADFRVQIRYKVQPGSLPRLRYGVSYQVRARAVDLAGNRIPFGDPALPDPHASPMITYGRFEPVDSPVVLLRKPRTPGESIEKIVIRSNYNTPPPATATTQRHISPTKIAEMTAEEHGLFDTPDVIDPAAFSLIVARDDKTYATSSQAKIDPFDYDGTQYFDVNKLHLPFFPDPIGRGASFIDLPGLPAGSIAKMPYLPAPTTKWPAYVPFRFILQEGSGAPVRDVTNGTLTVQIPKAEVATVRYSTYLDPADLTLLGVWQWLPAAMQAALQSQAVDGQLWALTPWRTLTLIHAVRQPLLIPQFISMPGPFRDTIGQTYAFFAQTPMRVARTSTGSLKVFADWTEAVDAGPGASVDPSHSPKSAVAFQVDLNDPLNGGAADTLVLQDERQEFHDTKYRRVSYRATATSKFAEFFQQTATVQLNGTTPTAVHSQGFVPETVKVMSLDGKTTYARDRDFVADEAAGTVARTSPSNIADGAHVLVPFVAPPVDRPGPGEAPIATTVDIPNSARPDAPDVLYMVPTWKWSTKAVAGGTRSTRTGGGLRVYMNRPWWSSGDGELLGVLLWPFAIGGPPEPPDALKPYVTRWGIDPIHASQSTTQPPTLSQFPRRTTSSSTPLSLEELADQPSVLVAGHAVGFDTVRKLWYCDIAVDTGPAYFPFVRLALARYQPVSLTNAHLSRAVLADFVQTVQGRSFTFVRSGTNPLLLTVTAVGISYSATRNADGTAVQGPSTMRVQLEQRSHKLAGELGWEAVGNPIELSPSPSGINTIWKGRVLLPSGNWPLRLVVEEVEKLSADGTFGPTGTLERLVYTDIVPISPDQFGVLTPTPSPVDFGGVAANQGFVDRTVTVTNTGTAPLTVGAVSIIGTDAAQFSITTDAASGLVINPGLGGSVSVRFTPTQIGTFNAQLDLPNDSIPNPLDVDLTGVGQGAILDVQPTSLDFGSQPVGITSPQVTLTLTNTGNVNLVIGASSIVGTNHAAFKIVTDASGVTVPAGGVIHMTLTARPGSTGTKVATLTIPSNAAGGTASVGLKVVGV